MDTAEYQRYKDPKSCFIPLCSNNSIKNPGIVFVYIRKELKEKWCKMVNKFCPKRALYCCEAHIDFEEDLENYHEWKVTKTRPRLKSTATLRINTEQADIPSSTNQDTETSASQNEGTTDATIHLDDDTGRIKDEHEETDIVEVPIENPVESRCSFCDTDIIGFRYACVQCADWDLCGACEARRAHPHHYVLRVPEGRPQGEACEVLRGVRAQVAAMLRAGLMAYIDEPEIKTEIEEDIPDPLNEDPNCRPHAGNILEQALLEMSVVKEEPLYLELELTSPGKAADDTQSLPGPSGLHIKANEKQVSTANVQMKVDAVTERLESNKTASRPEHVEDTYTGSSELQRLLMKRPSPSNSQGTPAKSARPTREVTSGQTGVYSQSHKIETDIKKVPEHLKKAVSVTSKPQQNVNKSRNRNLDAENDMHKRQKVDIKIVKEALKVLEARGRILDEDERRSMLIETNDPTNSLSKRNERSNSLIKTNEAVISTAKVKRKVVEATKSIESSDNEDTISRASDSIFSELEYTDKTYTCTFTRGLVFDLWSTVTGSESQRKKQVVQKIADMLIPESETLNIAELEKRVSCLCKYIAEYCRSSQRYKDKVAGTHSQWLEEVEAVVLKRARQVRHCDQLISDDLKSKQSTEKENEGHEKERENL